ncbi:MAG: hypothetical protein COA32_01405 [Fluviicola sp.]|nr:MAG: hypothetical protein COA32_01405 [Fluviicola sp.]
MKTTTVSLEPINRIWTKITFISLLFILFSFNNTYSQNKAADGMGLKERNFTTFNNNQKQNLDAWRSVNEQRFYNHPDFGTLPKNAPCTECVEDLSKREKDLRHFVDISDPSRFYIQRGNGLLHYKENGFWKTIDYRVTPSTTQGVYKSDFYLNNVTFNSVDQKAEIVTSNGSLELNQWSLYKKVNGEEQFIAEANWSSYTVGDDGMLVKNIFAGIDAELIIYPGGVKTNFIIKNAEFGEYETLVFRDNLTHSNQQPVEVDFKNYPGNNSEVDGVVVSSGGQPLAEFEEAVAYALNGNKESVRSLKYVLNNNTVDVEVPSSWIEKYKGDFDLVIDPQVSGSNTLAQASITGSQYNASCNFDNSCNQFLTVPAPANATFDDVLWSFTYEAVGACWLEDGAVRFATGGCLSPSQAGFYWFCNQIGGGTCAGTNVSVFSDLGGCLPGPSCAPQNVNFTMQFFRSCFGTAGCNNTCIGAFSPWTMTITGQTIAYTNVSNPITLSSPDVCEGGSLTATTSGQDGVPPYTYNWSFSPSGTPSVGAGASTSITFPTSGTQTLYSIITDNCGNQSTASVNVTVHPSPTPTITGDANYCEGQTAAISTGAFSSYNWSNGANTQNTTVTDADNPITVTVTDANGCMGTSAPYNVTEIPNPVPTISGDTDYCEGQNAAITTGAFSSYNWSNGANTQNTTVTDADNPITVTVTDANGCSGTSAPYNVTEIPSPTPTITGATSYCAGSSASISAPAGFSSYSWSNGANTQNTNVTDADNPITVTVTDANGCSGTSAAFNVTEEATINYSETIEICQGQSATIHGNVETTAGTYQQTFTTGGCDSIATITLTVHALPTITASATSTAICDGESTDLSASGGDTYIWDNGLGAGQNHTVSPSTTTTYEVTGTDANGCENTDQIEITVNPLPTVDAGADIVECEGVTITLTGSGTATSYTWDNGVSDGVGFTQSVGTVTYTVTGQDANGCENTDQVDVTIQTEPTVNAGADIVECEGTTITLTGSGTATTYTWDNGVADGVGFTQPVGTVTYTVTGTTGSSCSATDQVDVTINPNPTVDAGIDQSICDGDNVTLTGSGADTYTWDNGVTDGVPFTPGSTTTYTVTGENTATGCTATDDATITVNPLPTVGAGADQTICEGEEIVLSGTGADSYSWDNGVVDGDPFIPSSTTTYTVTGTDANGCENTANVTITLTPQPNANFTATPSSGQSPLEVDFNNNSNNGSSYDWDFGNGQTASSGTPSDQNMTYIGPGSYEVWLTVTNGTCSDQMSLIIIVEDLPLSYNIPNVFTPNEDGSNDILHMNIQNAASLEMEIFNRWGNLVGVINSTDPEDGWNGRHMNTGAPVSEGVYFYTYKIVGLNGEEIEGHNYVHLNR